MVEVTRDVFIKLINDSVKACIDAARKFRRSKDIPTKTWCSAQDSFDEIDEYERAYRANSQTTDCYGKKLPSLEWIKKTQILCRRMASFLDDSSVDAPEDTKVNPESCATLLQQLDVYAPLLDKDNYQTLSNILITYIPETKIISDIAEQERIRRSKKRKKEPTKEEDAKLKSLAENLFQILDNGLESMGPCQRRLELYEKSLDIVNYLDMGRIKKYEKKCQICKKIISDAEAIQNLKSLGKARKAYDAFLKAKYETMSRLPGNEPTPWE